jgi:tyrosyl-tRNA synthetase
MPGTIKEISISSQGSSLGLAHLLKEAGLVSSTSEAFRMIKQGAVKIDGERVRDKTLQISAGSTNIYQVGKRRFARVSLT